MICGDLCVLLSMTALARALLGGRGDVGMISGGVLFMFIVYEDVCKVSVEDVEFIV